MVWPSLVPNTEPRLLRGSVNHFIPSVEARLVAIDDDGKDAPHREVTFDFMDLTR